MQLVGYFLSLFLTDRRTVQLNIVNITFINSACDLTLRNRREASQQRNCTCTVRIQMIIISAVSNSKLVPRVTLLLRSGYVNNLVAQLAPKDTTEEARFCLIARHVALPLPATAIQ